MKNEQYRQTAIIKRSKRVTIKRIRMMKGAFFEHIPHYTVGLGSELGKRASIDVFFNLSSNSYNVPNCSSKRVPLEYPSYRRPMSYINILKQVTILRSYDIIHVNSSKQGIGAAISKKLYGKPFIYTNHGIPRLDFPESRKVDEKEYKLLPRIAKASSAFVTISKFVQKAIFQEHGVKAQVIYHGVDFSRFNAEVSPDRIRTKYGLDGKVILSVMRLHPHKDPFTLLDAFYNLLKKQRVFLLLIGSGPLEYKLKRFVEKKGFSEFIRFIPYVEWNDINQYYASADVVVLPSIDEGFGMTVVEGMACRKVPLVANSGALPEVVGNDELLFEPRNSGELCDKLYQMISDDDRRSELSLMAQERTKTLFRWDLAAEKYLQLYSKYT
ncbi:MAG: glycosyltransferase family 4 protein [Candidatus Thorarchaeota archaeon]